MAMAAIPLIGSIISGITDIVKARVPDVNQRAALEADLQKLVLNQDFSALMAQVDVNKIEAGSQNLFVAGWRPAVGWTCAGAMAYSFVLQPFIAFAIGAWGGKMPPLPVLDSGSLMTILLGMLGLAGARTYEKVKGVSVKG